MPMGIFYCNLVQGDENLEFISQCLGEMRKGDSAGGISLSSP